MKAQKGERKSRRPKNIERKRMITQNGRENKLQAKIDKENERTKERE